MATVEHKVLTKSHAVFWDIENVLPINHSFMPVLGLVLNNSHSLESMTLEETLPNHTTSQNARQMCNRYRGSYPFSLCLLSIT